MSRVYALIGAAAAGLVLAATAVAWHRHAVQQLVDKTLQEERGRQAAAANQALLKAEGRIWDLEGAAAIADLENRIEHDHLTDLARAAADRARTADERLQRATDDLRRRATEASESASAGSFAAEAAAAATALGECGREYRAVAAVADELSIQVTGLQGYVDVVLGLCFSNSPVDHVSHQQAPGAGVPKGEARTSSRPK